MVITDATSTAPVMLTRATENQVETLERTAGGRARRERMPRTSPAMIRTPAVGKSLSLVHKTSGFPSPRGPFNSHWLAILNNEDSSTRSVTMRARAVSRQKNGHACLPHGSRLALRLLIWITSAMTIAMPIGASATPSHRVKGESPKND